MTGQQPALLDIYSPKNNTETIQQPTPANTDAMSSKTDLKQYLLNLVRYV